MARYSDSNVLSVSVSTTHFVAGRTCIKHEHLEHILAQIKKLFASLGRASSILLLVSASLFFFGLCLKVAVFMKRGIVTTFRHDRDNLLILPQVADPRKRQMAANRSVASVVTNKWFHCSFRDEGKTWR
jgi:hypothetical protein